MPAPPETPMMANINIDMLLRVANQSFLHPVLVWFVPLAYRAQTFQYHHPPLYLSALYAALVTLWWIASYFNTRLAFGPARAFEWTEEVVVITGGASGLGLLVAEVYGMRGVSVAVLDVAVPDAAEVPNVHFYRCDVGDLAAVQAAAARITTELGPVTVLINNAAVVHGRPLLALGDADVERSFRTNILAHYHTLRTFLPGMVAAGRGSDEPYPS